MSAGRAGRADAPSVYVWPQTLDPRELIAWEQEHGLRVQNFPELFAEGGLPRVAESRWKLTLDREGERYVAGVATCVSHHSYRTVLVLEPRR